MSFEKIETGIKDLFIIEPQIFEDSRGFFLESYNYNTFKELGIENIFVQDNHSKSLKGVLRGLHFQKGEYSQAKLVRVLKGAVLDIAIDLRKNSKTFGKYITVELSEKNKKMFFIPRNFAHGFLTLEDNTEFFYKCDNFYAPQADGGICIKDESLGIDWRIPMDKALLSEKDIKHPCLEDFDSPFDYHVNLYLEFE